MYYFRNNILTIKSELKQERPIIFSGNSFLLAGVILMIIFKLKRKEIMPHIFSRRIIYAGFA